MLRERHDAFAMLPARADTRQDMLSRHGDAAAMATQHVIACHQQHRTIP